MLGGGEGAREARVNQLIWKVFTRKHGLTLQAEAVECLKRRLDCSLSEEELSSTFTLLVQAYKRQPECPSLVDAASLAQVIDVLIQSQAGSAADDLPLARNYFRLVNATECPRWEYDAHSRQCRLIRDAERPSVLGQPLSKIRMFRRHYEIIRQRTLQSQDFFGPQGVKLTSLKSVKGQQSGEKHLLLGMLSLMEEDVVYLEDPEDHLRLDLSPLQQAERGFYLETMLVVVGGRPNGDSFLVDFICPPPMVQSALLASNSALPNHGVHLAPDPAHLEASYIDATVVVLSELWLDCARSMDRFGQLLQELVTNDSVPSLFVIMGPFLSPLIISHQQAASPSPAERVKELSRGLQQLASLIARHAALVKACKFVLLPSLDDPLGACAAPRAPLPDALLSPLRQAEISCAAASNPCRILFFSKELLLCRYDLTVALKRHQLAPLADKGPESEALATVLEQGHLFPLPLSVQTRIWELDHALTVHPPPNFLIVAEHSVFRQCTQGSCQAINPGSFSAAEYSFVVLCPGRNLVRPCKLN